MKTTRRDVLSGFGGGLLFLGLGPAAEAGIGSLLARGDELDFGELESFVARMQETAPDELLPILVERLKAGVPLDRLLAAGALANARTFGGEDYNGYHAFMAMYPAYRMAELLPERERALPLLKVLYRSATFIQDSGGRDSEVLRRLPEGAVEASVTEDPSGLEVRAAMREVDVDAAERRFGRIARMNDPGAAFGELTPTLFDDIDVHRIVLAERLWESLRLVGEEHTHTLLRTFVRHCVDVEERRKERGQPAPGLRELLPRLLDRYELTQGSKGSELPDDDHLERLSKEIFAAGRAEGAELMAAALAEGFDPVALGEALSLAGNRLLLNDPGRERAAPGKPEGSVHGASVGLHASDAARAWRVVTRCVPAPMRAACMIVGAYHTAGQSGRVGREAFGYREKLDQVRGRDPESLRNELSEAVRAGDQALAVAVVERYESVNGEPRAIFDTLLRHSIEPDGALHAEKYFLTTHEDFTGSRPAFRWRHVKGLARVCASQAGFEAPGLELARELLGS